MTHPTRISLLFLLIAGLLATAVAPGCGSARREEPLVGPLHLSDADPREASALRGQQVFMQYCHECHPGGRAGLGPSLNDMRVPSVLISAQVRNGLGAMPAFPPEVISDEEMRDLISYLVALRQAGR